MKQYYLLSWMLLACLVASGQKSIPTNGLCTDTILFNAKGIWSKAGQFDRGTVTSIEANKRIDEIHKLLFQTIPQLKGVDATWHRSTGTSYFGSNMQKAHSMQLVYTCGFFPYYCDSGNTMNVSGETGTWFGVIANSTGANTTGDEDWLINGVPVIMQNRVQRTVRGFGIMQAEPGSRSFAVLIHRSGISPYLPITKKQYLDQCILYTTRVQDEIIASLDQIPVRTIEDQEKEKKARLAKFEKDFAADPKKLKANVDYYLSGYQTDQQRKEEQLSKVRKAKEETLKKFTDELIKVTTDGSVDQLAVISTKYQTDPVFEIDPAKGNLLVTENPAYIRKELPRHVPQFFIVYWTYNDWTSQKKIGEIIEQDFPFEKLQAMLDK